MNRNIEGLCIAQLGDELLLEIAGAVHHGSETDSITITLHAGNPKDVETARDIIDIATEWLEDQ